VQIDALPLEPSQDAAVEGFRLSAQQRRLWRVQEEGLSYRSRCALRLAGPLDQPRLAAALAAIVERHEILRTTFHSLPGMKVPLQSIGQGGPAWSRTALPGLGEAELAAVLEELFSRPAPDVAELRREPVVTAELIELAARDHVLLLDLPALCADAATLDLLAAEIAAAYEGADGGTPMQYADFSEWQNGWLAEEDSQEGRKRFQQTGREALEGAVPYGKAAGEGEVQPAVHRFVLEPWSELEAAAERLGASPAVFLLAAWQALLGRLTGAPEVPVATAFTGRTYEDLEQAFGLYVKHIPLTGRPVGERPFAELVAELEAAAREAAEWQDYWAPDEALAEIPTLSYGFELADAVPPRDLGGLVFSLLRRDCRAESFKLRLAATAAGGMLEIALHHDPAVLEPGDAERLACQLLTLLQGAVADPSTKIADLPLLDTAEREELLVTRNATAAPFPALAVHRLFEAQAARTPEAAALITPGGSLTYRELDVLAERVANTLAERGLGPGSRVGLLFERSPEMVAAMLGAWKAGAAYVALDPEHPEARTAYLLADTAAAVVLTATPLAGRVPAGTPALCVDTLGEPGPRSTPATGPEDPAYVVYTSGSTGRPKGVWIAHRGVANYLTWLGNAYGLGESDRVLQIPAPAFDASVRDIFGPLVHGASVVLLDGAASRDPRALARGIDRYAPSCVLSIVPTLLRGVLAAAGEGGSALRLLLVSGEPLRRQDVAAARRAWGADLVVANQYGPTECTMTSSYHLADSGATGALPIGRPIANARFYVLDERLAPVPAGIPGELAIGGPGLALGYLGAPDLTAARFVPDPFGEPGGRLYRTGDLVRWAGPDLEFLGRIDQQVKLRGVRVEPQEVAAVLARHPAVAEAAVVARELANGEPGLVAYVVADRRQAPAVPEEQRHVLPNGMLVAQRNRHETDFFYEQIFVDQVELRHGLRVPDRGVIFDVGANIGLFTLFAHQACRNPRVFSFEPIPEIFATLRANVELYGLDAVIENCGLSDQSGEATFAYYPRSSCQSGYYPDAAEETRMLKAVVARQRTQAAGDLSGLLGASYFEKLIEERMEVTPVTCPLKTISQVIAERGIDRVDLLKIDVEKAELDVLRGIRDEDWPKIRQIVIEGHDLDGLLARVTSLLESRGYDLVVEQDETLGETCLYNIYAFRDGRPVESEVPPLEVRPFPAPAAALLSVDALRSFAAERLPAALMPAAFVVLDELPRTPNGKLDARALPAPGEDEGGDSTPPRNQVEELLAGIWGEILGLDRMSVHLNFFEAGGHSLLATQLLARVQDVLGIELPLRTIFEAPTVAQLAEIVEASLALEGGRRPPRIERAPRNGELPLSFAQQRHWFLHRLEGGSALLNVWGAVALSGQLDVEALERSLGRILERHEVLRTTYPEAAGEPRLRIHPVTGFRLPMVDLTPLAEDERRRQADQRIELEARRPFDLAEGPLFRALLLRLEGMEHVIVVTMHHIAADGWSSAILMRELCELYSAGVGGREPRLPELPVQYADFAAWQRRWLTGEVLEEQLGYWERQLAGAPEVLELPTDRPRSGRESFSHGRQPIVFPAPLAGAIRALSRRHGVTVFTILLAGLQTLLHWFSGQDDVSVGSPIANRNRIETEGLIGCFINALVLRARLGGDPTFEEVLAQAGETVLGAYAHQDLPFERLVEHLNPARGQGRPPLFQVELNFQSTPISAAVELPGLTLRPLHIEREEAAKYDLILRMWGQGEELGGALTYKSELFEADTAAALAEHFERLLERVAAQPDIRLSALKELLTEADRQRRAARQHEIRQARRGVLKQVQREAVHEV
jgi:amino acid adenylation domain-containing protein/FkbM family methyltransferase